MEEPKIEYDQEMPCGCRPWMDQDEMMNDYCEMHWHIIGNLEETHNLDVMLDLGTAWVLYCHTVVKNIERR